MKIDGALSGTKNWNAVEQTSSAAETSATKAAARPGSDSKAGRAESDSATVSAGAALASHLAQASDVRAEKVASVQQALASGSYRVDAGKVADKIIASMQQKP